MPDTCHFFLNPSNRNGFTLDRKFNKVYRNEDPIAYHRKLRKYEPTPLVSLPRLAKRLGIKELYVKDESKRFRMNTFKALGASFAIYKVSETLNGKATFCTASDGNHGRSVAWATRKAKQKAVIYLPANTADARIRNIRKFRAQVVLVDGDYDMTVQRAREDAEKKGYMLVQDTSWEGYTEIPTLITTGYKTMMNELEDSLHSPREPGIDFVFLQSGVGTWASSVVAYYRNRYPRKMPKLVVVEPNESNALLESCKQKSLVRTRQSQQTIMTGLNCGTPSLLAWNILKDGVDLFLSIPDTYAIKAMQYMYYPFKKDKQIFSGEAGSAGLAGLAALSCDESLEDVKSEIGLDNTSRVLVFNTEGVTDPESFDELISREVDIP